MKKILSLVLVLTLVLGSFSMAFATPSDVEGTDFATPVDVLMALEVVTGYPDGTFNPDGAVTRAEMATMLVKVLGLGDVASFVGASGFSDTAGHWGDKYIAVVSGQDIVNGYPDGTFKPNNPVSFPEAITMIVRALGYTDDAASIKGTWPVNYIVKANDLDITDDVDVVLAGYANRGACAEMIYNALTVETVTLDADGAEKDAGILIAKLDAEGPIEVDIDAGSVTDDEYTLIDLTEYAFANVDVYKLTTGDKEIVAVDDVNDDKVVGLFEIDDETVASVDADGDDVDVSVDFDGIEVLLNGGVVDYDAVKDYLDEFEVTVYGELNDDEDAFATTVSGIIAWAPTAVHFADDGDLDDIEDAIDDGEGEAFGITFATDDDELDMSKITVMGAVDSLEDIEEDDVVYVYAAANDVTDAKVKFEVIRDTEQFKITKESSTKVYDGSTAYKFSAVDDSADGDDAADITDSDVEVGNTLKFFLDKDGKIFAVETVDATTDNYAVVVARKDGSDDGFGDYDNAEVKLFLATEEVVTFEVDNDVTDVDSADNSWTGSTITPGALVKYSVDSDGIIDELDDQSTTSIGLTEYNGTTETLNGKFFEDGVLIFDITAVDEDDWTVIEEMTDEADYAGNYVLDGTKYEAFVITNDDAAPAESDYFALVSIAQIESGDDDVYELEGFDGGVAKTTITKDLDNGDLDSVTVTAPGIYMVTYSSAKVDDADYLDYNDFDYNAQGVTAAAATYIQTDAVYELDDDLVVYKKVFDADDDLETYEVIDVEDINEDDVVWMMNNSDDTGIILIIVTDESDIAIDSDIIS